MDNYQKSYFLNQLDEIRTSITDKMTRLIIKENPDYEHLLLWVQKINIDIRRLKDKIIMSTENFDPRAEIAKLRTREYQP